MKRFHNDELIAILVLLCSYCSSASANFIGVRTEGLVSRSVSTNGAVTGAPHNSFGPDGGDGVLSATTVDTDPRGDTFANANFSGSSQGVPVPVLTADALGGTDGLFLGIAQAFSGAVGSYCYQGPPGMVTFNWEFVGTLHEPDITAQFPNTETTAFFNIRGGLVRDLLQFETDIQQANALATGDTFAEAYNTDLASESFNENGSISISANSGDVISLLLMLSTWGGNPDARADGLMGLTGTFVVPQGGSLKLVPEPNALMLLVGGLLFCGRSAISSTKKRRQTAP